MTDENPYAAPDPRFGTPPAPPVPPYQQFPPPQFPPPQFPPPQFPAQPYAQPYPPPPYPPQPAGYPAYQAPHVFRGNRGLGAGLLVLGAVFVLAQILRAATAPAAIHAYDRAVQEGRFGPVATAHDAVGILMIVVIPLWIVGSLWLQRAYENARALIPANMHRSIVWCWLAWIVPIVQYWFPKQIVDDVWHTTGYHLAPESKNRRRSTGLWWGLWVAFVIADAFTLRFGFYASAGAPTSSAPVDLHHGVRPGWETVIALLAVAAYAAWVPVVVSVSRAQEELKARFSPSLF